jgi:hypothetical protein
MQTPAIMRPKCGRHSGRPGIADGTGTAAPQFEQKRAVGGNPVPQRLQNTAIFVPSPRKANTLQIRRWGGRGSIFREIEMRSQIPVIS